MYFLSYLILSLPILLFAHSIRFTDIISEKEAWGNRENDVSCHDHGVAMADICGDSLLDIYISLKDSRFIRMQIISQAQDILLAIMWRINIFRLKVPSYLIQ